MEYFLVYLIGGVLYGFLELCWRGWTHWTMLLCGGACFCIMYAISSMAIPLWRRCILSAAAITTVEFFTGYVVNMRLHWQIWDYSAMPGNLLGQICPQFLLLWLALSLPGLWLCARLHELL
jgi:uncharacterized membrane protein